MSPRSAYVHVPFCRHRCGYCNFTLVAGRDDLIESYLQAIDRELSWLQTPCPVDTLFLGGGTPSHLEEAQLRRLLELVCQWFPLAAAGEWSVEANPADVSARKARLLAEMGVTRLSLGAQSFAQPKLRILERDHDAARIGQAVAHAKQHGLHVALDLIFAVPEETISGWESDLQEAVALEPAHVSTYGLTFEKGTRFWSRRRGRGLASLDEETERAMYELAIDKLTACGFEHYEVSNFARPGQRCRHNEVYWLGESYYAAGPGAARYVNGLREINHRSTTYYLNKVLADESPIAEAEILTPEQQARDVLVFGLRRLEGVDVDEFRQRTGFDLQALAGQPLRRFVRLGLLEYGNNRYRLTRKGLMISDALWPDLLVSDENG